MAKNESNIDILTGLYNRRGFQEQAKQLFGNPIGDEYLKAIASFLSAMPAEHSVCARLGGDEFAAILYGFSSPKPISRLIQKLEKKRGTEFLSSSLGAKERVEFSIGYAYCLSENPDHQKLMSLADEKMYQDKRERKARMQGPS